MRGYNNQSRWHQVHGKKRAHLGILTLDDLPKTNGKYSVLIAQLKSQYLAAKEVGGGKPKKKSEDFSI